MIDRFFRGIAIAVALAGSAIGETPPLPPGFTIPVVDISSETRRHIIVDREPGKYLGHPSTVLLEDGKTLLCVYPEGHGKGPIRLRRSVDGGRTWSGNLPVPANWSTSKETPTIHRIIDGAGRRRLIVFSGLYPVRTAFSEDDGNHWTELLPAGDWGGIVAMASVEAMRGKPGHYLALFHDDGRFQFAESIATKPPHFALLQSRSNDGGLTWSRPETLFSRSDVHLCEPGLVRSPDGRELAVLLRENTRTRNSWLITSRDEGSSWTPPRELPAALTGDRHVARYLRDGRLFISFRDTARKTPTPGDWVAWVGRYDDIIRGREGRYRVRLMDNQHSFDCAYPGVEVLPDGTIVTVTYGHWITGQQPFLVCLRLDIADLDRRAR
jgi:hypothetical protein